MSGITGGGSAVAAGSSSSSYHNLPAWVKEQTRGEPRSEPFPENFDFQTRFDAYLKRPLSEAFTVPRLQRELDSYGMLYKYSVKAGNDMILIQPDSYLQLNMFHATLHASGGRSFSSVGALHVKGEGAHRSKGIAIRFVPEFDSEGKFSGVSLSNVVGDATLKPRMQTFANNVKEAITNVFKQIDEIERTDASSSSSSGASSAAPGAVGGGSAQTGTAEASSSSSAPSSAVPRAVGKRKPSDRAGALQYFPQHGPKKAQSGVPTAHKTVKTKNKHKTQHNKLRHAVADAVSSARTYKRSKRANGAWIYTAENDSGNVKEEETSLADLQNTNGGWKLRKPGLFTGTYIMVKPGQMPRPVKSRRTRRSTRRRRT